MAMQRFASPARLNHRPEPALDRCRSRSSSAHPLTLWVCLLWAALWSLLAAAQADLPEVTEQQRASMVDSFEPAANRSAERERAALMHQMQLRVEHALQQRLPDMQAFEITQVSNLRLRPDDAQLEVWGLLQREGQPSVMLQMLGHIDRGRYRFHIDGVRAYSQQREQTQIGLSLSVALTDLTAEDSWQAAR